MTDTHDNTPSPRVLVLEDKKEVSDRVEAILAGDGWKVTCETRSKDALEQLKTAGADPFTLFICSFKLPLMEGDDVLKKAGKMSPDTQRMLLVPLDKPDTLISAINKANINACITYTFEGRDLENQAATCLDRYNLIKKQQQLKRVVGHQNKKMFQMARTLKKKADDLQVRINEKKAEKLVLTSRIKQAGSRTGQQAGGLLALRLRKKDPDLSPETFAAAYGDLMEYIKGLFNGVAAKSGLSPVEFSKTDIPVPDEWGPVVEKILKTACISPGNREAALSAVSAPPGEKTAETPEEIVGVTVSEDQTTAYIRKLKEPEHEGILTLETLLECLRQGDITYGILGDDVLASWIASAKPEDHPRIAALGDPPKEGKDGKIIYHFETDYTNPGKILENGSIDFRDRGDIPFAQAGDILAKKEPAVEAVPGTSVRGTPLPVPEVHDPPLTAGPGTQLSEDGLSVSAAREGQPHVDAMGNLTVSSDLTIKGNIDFQTGNVDFDGTVMVTGTVKDGFRVRCIHLIAGEIQGGIIDAKGDVCVSGGITDADITAQGNVFAKFVNNSDIKAFGDVTVQKEIIDTKVLISGCCRNAAGHVISSDISARNGIEAGKIGTDTSRPAVLCVGMNDHADLLGKQIDGRVKKSVAHLQELRDKVSAVEEQDQALYEDITRKAQEQEAAQNRIKEIQSRVRRMDGSGAGGPQNAQSLIRELADTAKSAERTLEAIFERQDRYAAEIEDLKSRIGEVEQANKDMMLKKRAILEYAGKKEARAQVIVNGRLTQDTMVKGPNTELKVSRDRQRCWLKEVLLREDGLQVHEMRVSDL